MSLYWALNGTTYIRYLSQGNRRVFAKPIPYTYTKLCKTIYFKLLPGACTEKLYINFQRVWQFVCRTKCVTRFIVGI